MALGLSSYRYKIQQFLASQFISESLDPDGPSPRSWSVALHHAIEALEERALEELTIFPILETE